MVLFSGCALESDGANAPLPKLHALTYASTLDARLTLSIATAEFYDLFPIVLGYGHEATWAYGLSDLANMVRAYIFNHTAPEDIVLFFDAWDVAFQAGEHEIVSRYLEMEAREHKQLIYHAEGKCSSPRKNEYPHIKSEWRYLNCGLYIGRSRAMRELYKAPVPSPLVDKHGHPMRLQNWHTDYYLDHQDSAMLDSQCELMQVVMNVDNIHVSLTHPDSAQEPGGRGLLVKDGRLRNTITKTTPLILHFPGVGHWPDWWHPDRVGTCAAYEFLRETGHPTLLKFLEKQSSRHKSFALKPYWRVLVSATNTVRGNTPLVVQSLAQTMENALWPIPHIL